MFYGLLILLGLLLFFQGVGGTFGLALCLLDWIFTGNLVPGRPWLAWAFWGTLFGGVMGFWTIAPAYGLRGARRTLFAGPLILMVGLAILLSQGVLPQLGTEANCNLTGTWDLYPVPDKPGAGMARAVHRFVVTRMKDGRFHLDGAALERGRDGVRWSADGSLKGHAGRYDWKFENGSAQGSTTFLFKQGGLLNMVSTSERRKETYQGFKRPDATELLGRWQRVSSPWVEETLEITATRGSSFSGRLSFSKDLAGEWKAKAQGILGEDFSLSLTRTGPGAFQVNGRLERGSRFSGQGLVTGQGGYYSWRIADTGQQGETTFTISKGEMHLESLSTGAGSDGVATFIAHRPQQKAQSLDTLVSRSHQLAGSRPPAPERRNRLLQTDRAVMAISGYVATDPQGRRAIHFFETQVLDQSRPNFWALGDYHGYLPSEGWVAVEGLDTRKVSYAKLFRRVGASAP